MHDSDIFRDMANRWKSDKSLTIARQSWIFFGTTDLPLSVVQALAQICLTNSWIQRCASDRGEHQCFSRSSSIISA